MAFIEFYMYLHSDQGIPSSELDKDMRAERGEMAAELAKEMQRAMLALIGSHRRRTYAHDLVYGIYQLYMLFGKPWNAATEGSEHAHQDMKQFFHGMVTHSPRSERCDVYQVLRLGVVKRQMLRDHATLLPHSKYAAMRANRVLAEESVAQEGKVCGKDSGPKGLKCYKEDEEMRAVQDQMKQLARSPVVDV